MLVGYWTKDFDRYVEPFAGSAALFFRIQPQRALLGDINGALIGAYQTIRERPDDVYRAVTSMRRSEHQYYRVRKLQPEALSDFERAVRFVYLNRYCFNGIYRTNTDGQFNVPYAHKKPGVIPPIEDFRRAAVTLNRATLKCGDFGSVLSSVRRGDFVYIDPPYAVEARRVFRQYDRRAFTKRDLSRLAKHLHTLDKKGAAFVVSYADCKEARNLLGDWPLRRIAVRRNVAGFASKRRTAIELLVTNISP